MKQDNIFLKHLISFLVANRRCLTCQRRFALVTVGRARLCASGEADPDPHGLVGPLSHRSTPWFDFRRVFRPRDKKCGFGHWGVEEVSL